MIRYLLILLIGGILLMAFSSAWAQEKPSAAGGQDDKPLRNPFQRPGTAAAPEEPEEDKIIFKQLPSLRLRGILKFKDKEPVGLLEIAFKDELAIYRVRKGDQISVTLPGEDVIRTSDLKPPPQPVVPPGAQGVEGQAQPAQQPGTAQAPNNMVGVATRTSPKVTLKEVQVVFEIVEIDLHGLAIEAMPLNERILVR
ncbi:MAG: hypothetical protein ACYTG7_25115 [Planctomycetota bacterium]|jgi:hypothetical protein